MVSLDFYTGLVILIILIILYIFVRSTSSTEIILFYRDSCPHCIRMKPEWAKFEQMVANDNSIVVRNLPIGENADLAQKYGVMGVPFIVKINSSGVTKYEGPRTADDFYKFACSS